MFPTLNPSHTLEPLRSGENQELFILLSKRRDLQDRLRVMLAQQNKAQFFRSPQQNSPLAALNSLEMIISDLRGKLDAIATQIAALKQLG